MVNASQGSGWWLASDGKWYPPHLHPSHPATSTPEKSWWLASDGKWYPPETHPGYGAMQASSAAAISAPPHVASGPIPISDEPPAPGQHVVGTPTPPPKQHRWSVTAILSVVIALLFWPAGIFTGHWMLRKLHRTGQKGQGFAITGLVLSYALGASTVALVALALSNPSGFNNPTILQESVVTTVNTKLHSQFSQSGTNTLSLTSAICVDQSGTQWDCVLSLSDGRQVSLPVSVTSSGTRWVTDGNGGLTVLLAPVAPAVTLPPLPTANDTSTQSNLTNIITSAKAIYAQNDAYPATLTMARKLKADEPEFTYLTSAGTAALTSSAKQDTIAVLTGTTTGTKFVAVAYMTRTKECWVAADTANGTNAGVHYGYVKPVAGAKTVPASVCKPTVATASVQWGTPKTRWPAAPTGH